jgi:hypothetical protein
VDQLNLFIQGHLCDDHIRALVRRQRLIHPGSGWRRRLLHSAPTALREGDRADHKGDRYQGGQ